MARSGALLKTGRHGFVTGTGNRFVFEDGAPVRFFGAQMNQLPKEQAKALAARITMKLVRT